MKQEEDDDSTIEEVGSSVILGLYESMAQLNSDTQSNFAVTRFNY